MRNDAKTLINQGKRRVRATRKQNSQRFCERYAVCKMHQEAVA